MKFKARTYRAAIMRALEAELVHSAVCRYPGPGFMCPVITRLKNRTDRLRARRIRERGW